MRPTLQLLTFLNTTLSAHNGIVETLFPLLGDGVMFILYSCQDLLLYINVYPSNKSIVFL